MLEGSGEGKHAITIVKNEVQIVKCFQFFLE